MESTQHLRSRLTELREREPRLRSRDLAHRLGISEAELVSLDLGADVIRLGGDMKKIIKDVHRMGYVMALTRNEHVIHERKGVYDNITFYDGHGMGVAVNEDIDLRFFMNDWAYCLAVIMRRKNGGDLHGLQFFDVYGRAVHKIYATPESKLDGWATIVDKYMTDQEPITIENREAPRPPAEKPDAEIDVAAFREAWLGMTDTHQFFGMLKKYGVTRPQALRLAPEGMVSPVDRMAVATMLEQAAERQVSIMCFVPSPGCIQIHTGPVKNIRWMDKWLNVLDPKFNLHLDSTAIDRAFVVRKPTEDGIVTSLELFDAEGELFTYFFGARKPGKPELTGWTEIAEGLTPVTV